MVDVWGFSFISTKDYLKGTDVPYSSFKQTMDRHIATVVEAERFGFDGWGWAEHHFHPSSISPSPHLLISHIAAKTSILRFAVLGSVLSLHDPRRLAEESAMLDLLTEGRYDIGIAPGAGPFEAMRAGVPADEVRPRYQSGAEFLAKAVGQRTVTHQDAFSNVVDLPIVPPLRAELADRMWAMIMTPPSAEWAARLGYRLVTGWLPNDVAAGLAQCYREAREAAGRPFDRSMLGLRRRIFVADTDAEAQERFAQAEDVFLTLSRSGQMLEAADEKILKLFEHPDDMAIGSPDTVAEKLIHQCRTGGYGTLMAFTDFATFTPDELRRSHELLGTVVKAKLQAADLTTEAKGSVIVGV
jgi:alkanesulfonate monooxygenase SsuD/methylene tetrahydromethanopterin reductase-like flavin-dependent oxidoreductase (luciferase family)